MVAGGLVVLLLLLVALAPTLVNWGVGRGAILGVIERRVNGTVRIRGLDLGWFGSQSVDGLEIIGADRRTAVKLALEVDVGLLGLLTRDVEKLEIDLSGTVRGELRQDGTSFEDLFAGTVTADDTRRRRSKRGVSWLGRIPATTVRISQLSVDLREAGSSRSIEFDDLRGTLGYSPGRFVKMSLEGATSDGTTNGSISIDGRVSKLFNKAGVLTLSRASGRLDVNVQHLAIPLSDPPVQVRSLALSARSDDLSEQLDVSVDLSATIDGTETGQLNATLAVERPVARDGSIAGLWQLLARLTGSIEGRSVPLALIQPALQGTPVSVVRDLGPTVDVTARFSGGDDMDVSVTATAESASLDFSGRIDSRRMSLADGRLHVSVTVRPELFSEATGISISRPVTIILDIESMSLPPMGDEPAMRVGLLAARGQLAVKTPVTIEMPGERPFRFDLENGIIRFDSPGLDRGGTADATASINGAEVSLTLLTDALMKGGNVLPLDRIELAGTVAVQGLTNAQIAALVPAQTELIMAVTDEPVDVTVHARLKDAGLHVEVGATNPDLEFMATLDGPVRGLMTPEGTPALDTITLRAEATIHGLDPAALAALLPEQAGFIGETLAEPVTVTAAGTIDGGLVHLEFRAASPDLTIEATADAPANDLVDAEGKLAVEQVSAHATATIVALKPSVLTQLAPGQADLVVAAINDPLEVTVTAALEGGTTRIRLTAAGPDLDLDVTVTEEAGTLRVDSSRARLLVTPRLVAALQNATDPIALTEPVELSLDLDPFEVPEWRASAIPGAIIGRLALADAVLDRVPGLAEPLGVRGLHAEVSVRLDDPLPSVSVDGSLRLGRSGQPGEFATVRLTAKDLGRERIDNVSLEITELSTRALARMLDGEWGGRIADWIGETGTLTLTLDERRSGNRVTINAAFPNFSGEIVAVDDGEMISITASDTALSLNREALQRALSPAGPGGESGRNLTVASDVPFSLTVHRVRFGREAITEGRFDPSRVDIDVALTGGPIILDDSQLGPNSIERLAIRVTSRDLDRGLDISVTGDVNFHGANEPGRIQLDATLTGLITDGVPTPDRTRLVMTAKIHGLHTALVDTVADLGGLLVAAVGPRADLEATVDNFSSNSGTLTATLTATNGRLEGRVTGGDNGLTVAGAPIRAELEITPPLCDRLLRKVHPLFPDIRTTDQPLRVELTSAFIPLDGDVSRLQAQFDITVGRVELDSGSAMLAALTIFNAVKGRPGHDSSTISGYIEPIKATIVDGVMSYDAFVVRIDKYTLVYAGTVDLNTQTLDLTTHVPLAALVSSFTGALKGLPPETAVPLITRGPIDNPTTTVDPSFVGDAVGKAAEDLLKKEIENAAKKHLGGIFGSGGPL